MPKPRPPARQPDQRLQRLHRDALPGDEKAGESDERVFAVAAWRDSPYFNGAERAALALTEAATRLAGRPDPVPDEVWNDAAKHYGERALAGLIVEIGYR